MKGFVKALCIAVTVLSVMPLCACGTNSEPAGNTTVLDITAPTPAPKPTPAPSDGLGFEPTVTPDAEPTVTPDAEPTVTPDIKPTATSVSTPEPTDGNNGGSSSGDKLVALTFDDGPYSSVTPVILDVVEQYADQNVHVTFFELGTQIEKYPEIVKRAVELGCEIGNHTYSHDNLTKISVDEMHEELDKTSELVRKASGFDIKLVRPPYGAKDDSVKANVGYPLILWSVDTLDWKTRDTQSTFKAATEIQNGDIVLMHDVHGDTAEAVKLIVPELLRQGYKLVTVSELFKATGEPLKKGVAYRYSR